MKEGPAQELVWLRNRLHEASCNLALIYLEADKELRKIPKEEEVRHDLFKRLLNQLRELQDIREALDAIASKLREAKQ
jgi:hypothetical protein